MSVIELSLYGEATLKQEFSIIPPTNSRFPEFTIESGNGKYDMVAKMVDSKKKCCDNCKFFAESEMEFAEGFCMKNVANTLCGQYIEGKDTFYCSYHKLRLNNE